MRAENTLRRRLVAAIVLLAVIVGGVFAAAAYVIVEALEHEHVEVHLARALEVLVRSDRAGAPPPSFLDVRLAVGEEIPPQFSELEPGLHELDSEGRVLQVLIASEGGKRYAAIDDVTDFERLEILSFIALGVAFGAFMIEPR